MPSNKPIFTLRTDRELLDKLHALSERESRSDNKQLEYILIEYIRMYEEQNGKLNTEQ